MELVTMKCPQCMGDVIPFGDGSSGRCDCCDSVFALSGATRQAAAATVAANDEPEESTSTDFDPETFFDDFANELDADDDYDFLIGIDLETDKGRKKIKAATKYFNIDNDEEIYLILDSTIFGSCKTGFACCESGIYMMDEDGDECYLAWEDFADADLEKQGTKLLISNSPFITTPQSATVLFSTFRRLQKEI